jgi:hypothetical protein
MAHLNYPDNYTTDEKFTDFNESLHREKYDIIEPLMLEIVNCIDFYRQSMIEPNEEYDTIFTDTKKFYNNFYRSFNSKTVAAAIPKQLLSFFNINYKLFYNSTKKILSLMREMKKDEFMLLHYQKIKSNLTEIAFVTKKHV